MLLVKCMLPIISLIALFINSPPINFMTLYANNLLKFYVPTTCYYNIDVGSKDILVNGTYFIQNIPYYFYFVKKYTSSYDTINNIYYVQDYQQISKCWYSYYNPFDFTISDIDMISDFAISVIYTWLSVVVITLSIVLLI